jgi:hypothetical protein
MGANCDKSLDTSQIHYDSNNDIVVETTAPFEEHLCIEASTIGKKTARSIIEFEICGNQVISLQKVSSGFPDKITKHYYKAKSGTETIYISSEGHSFTSSSQNCGVDSYSLV